MKINLDSFKNWNQRNTSIQHYLVNIVHRFVTSEDRNVKSLQSMHCILSPMPQTWNESIHCKWFKTIADSIDDWIFQEPCYKSKTPCQNISSKETARIRNTRTLRNQELLSQTNISANSVSVKVGWGEGGGDNMDLLELSFAHITTKTWEYSIFIILFFYFFYCKAAKMPRPPVKITF